MNIPDIGRVRDYLTGLQDRICTAIEGADGSARFLEDAWTKDPASSPIRGGGRTRVLREGLDPDISPLLFLHDQTDFTALDTRSYGFITD